MIQIDIRSLKPGIHEFEWQPEAEALDLDTEVFREMKVSARLDFHPSRIFVTLETQARAHLTCDRTLVKFDQDVDGTHSVLFSSEEMLAEGEEQDDDIRELGKGDEEIDLTDIVRDTFILSIPARKIAPGADEEEIPLSFGKPDTDGQDVDPRWEALRKLSSMQDKNEGEE